MFPMPFTPGGFLYLVCGRGVQRLIKMAFSIQNDSSFLSYRCDCSLHKEIPFLAHIGPFWDKDGHK